MSSVQKKKYIHFFDHSASFAARLNQQTAVKKKMFCRKPVDSQHSNLLQKRSKLNTISSSKFSKSINLQERSENDQKTKLKLHIKKQKLAELQSQNSRQSLKYEPLKNIREVYFTPKASRLELENQNLDNFSIGSSDGMQALTFKNQQGTIATEGYRHIYNQNYFKANPSQKILKTRAKSYTMLLSQFEEPDMAQDGKSQVGSLSLHDEKACNPDENSTISDGHVCLTDRNTFQECKFCKNNKKMIQMLNEKHIKIRQQLKSKDQLIIRLQSQLEINIEKENRFKQMTQTNNQKYKKTIEDLIVVNKQLQEQNQRTHRQFIHKSQRVKYLQIQNSILHRYKDQNQEMVSKCQQLQKLNQFMKKKLIDNQKSTEKSKQKVINLSQSHKLNKTDKQSQQEQFKLDQDQGSLSFSENSIEI